MKLYKILFEHFSPKDSAWGLKTYALAQNEEQIYKWIDKTTYGSYTEQEEEDEDFKGRIMECRGEMFCDEVELYDLHYGAILYGWEEGVEVTVEDIAVLTKLGLLVDLRDIDE